jgi:hypothetical protein
LLRRWWWTAERFGLTPRKLLARGASALPKVLCVSLPKAGTHLVERALCLHPRLYRKIVPTLNPANVGQRGGLAGLLASLRPGQVLLAHLPFDPSSPELLEREGVKALFVVRDPRDIVVSLAHYIGARGDHPLHSAYAGRDVRARIELAILGDSEARPPAPSIESLLAGFAGWLESGALVVRFEDLVGERGGGDAGAQARTVDAVYAHLGLESSPELAARTFSDLSPTFRKGSIGQWREHFDPELEALLEREAGRWMEVYGYR